MFNLKYFWKYKNIANYIYIYQHRKKLEWKNPKITKINIQKWNKNEKKKGKEDLSSHNIRGKKTQNN